MGNGNALIVADAAVLVALIDARDRFHRWAVSQASQMPGPWFTCEAALSETFHLIDQRAEDVWELLRRGFLKIGFCLDDEIDAVVSLMEKYQDLPMSLADACIVRMTEVLPNPLVLTTDSDFRLYRRHGRKVVPCRMP